MANPSGDKGWMAEDAVVQYLRGHGFPHSERRSKKGNKDQGDILSAPGLVWEVKYNGKGVPIRMAEWMRQTDVEAANAKADYGILVIKPAGIGKKSAHNFWAVMRFGDWIRLVHAAEPRVTPSLVSQPHSSARISTLAEHIRKIETEMPYATWEIHVPARVPFTAENSLVVQPLYRAVQYVRAAGYGEPLPSDHGETGRSENQ